MVAFCPKCEKWKDGSKFRSKACCQACYNEIQARTRGVKIPWEELKEREEAVQQREEAVMQRESRVRVREELVSAREQAIRVRECMKSKEEEKTKQAQKRAREEEGGPSPKQKRFCALGLRRRQQLVAEAASHLKRLSRGEPGSILDMLSGKLGWRREERQEINFIANLAEFSRTYLPSLPEPSRIAGLLTRGLTLEEAHGVTRVPVSSLSWGRREIENGRFFQLEVRQPKQCSKGEKRKTDTHW